jgi:hypothetical protein
MPRQARAKPTIDSPGRLMSVEITNETAVTI